MCSRKLLILICLRFCHKLKNPHIKSLRTHSAFCMSVRNLVNKLFFKSWTKIQLRDHKGHPKVYLLTNIIFFSFLKIWPFPEITFFYRVTKLALPLLETKALSANKIYMISQWRVWFERKTKKPHFFSVFENLN